MLRKGRMLLATITAALCAGTLIAAVACSEDPVEPKPEGNTYTVTYTAGYTGATDPDLTESHKEGEQFTLRAADAFSRGGGIRLRSGATAPSSTTQARRTRCLRVT